MPLYTMRWKVEKKFPLDDHKIRAKIFRKVYAPLCDRRDSSVATPDEEETSRERLAEALRQCKKILPKTKRYLYGDNYQDVGYYGVLFSLQNALMERRWGTACYVAQKMIRYYPCNDARNMNCLIDMLEASLFPPNIPLDKDGTIG